MTGGLGPGQLLHQSCDCSYMTRIPDLHISGCQAMPQDAHSYFKNIVSILEFDQAYCILVTINELVCLVCCQAEDIELDPELKDACANDAMKFCQHVTHGNAAVRLYHILQ